MLQMFIYKFGIYLQFVMHNNIEANFYFKQDKQHIDHQSQYFHKNSLQLLRRQICTKFTPFKEYFIQQPIARIVSSKPQFRPTLSKNLRNNLKVERQIMYLKGNLSQDYGEEILEQYLAEEQYQSIENIKNTSIFLEGKLYYCENTKLMFIDICNTIKKQKINGQKEIWSSKVTQGTQIFDAHERIYELRLYKKSILIRTSRIIFLFNQSEVNKICHLPQQIITFYAYDGNGLQKLIISTFEDKISSLYQIYLGRQSKLELFCKIDGLVNSLWALTQNQYVICKENAIQLVDKREKTIIDLHRRLSAYRDRIYSGLNIHNNQHFMTTQSYSVNAYDIRKCHEPLLKIPHYCEQSPPSILQLYNNQQNIRIQDILNEDEMRKYLQKLQEKAKLHINDLLIAHSPYQNGSTLLAQLNLHESQQEILVQSYLGETNQFANRFRLAYDSGKIVQGYYPLSVTPITLQNKIGLLHIDNYYGVSFQLLQNNSLENKSLKKSKNNKTYSRVNILKQEGIETLKDPNCEWFNRFNLSKQLQSTNQDFWVEQIKNQEISMTQNHFQDKNVRYADLKDFYSNIYERSLIIDPQKSIQEQQKRVIMSLESHTKSKIFVQTQNTQSLNEQKQVNNHIRGMQSEDDLNQLFNEWNL